jgi:hypothetical protein
MGSLTFLRFDPTSPASAEQHENARYRVLSEAFYQSTFRFNRAANLWVSQNPEDIAAAVGRHVVDGLLARLEADLLAFVRACVTQAEPASDEPGGGLASAELGGEQFVHWAIYWLACVDVSDRAQHAEEGMSLDLMELGGIPAPVIMVTALVCMLLCEHVAEAIDQGSAGRAHELTWGIHKLHAALADLERQEVGAEQRHQQTLEQVKANREQLRQNALAANDSLHARDREARQLACAKWDLDRKGADTAAPVIADWLEAQGFRRYSPRTVAGWIREHAKSKNVRLR